MKPLRRKGLLRLKKLKKRYLVKRGIKIIEVPFKLFGHIIVTRQCNCFDESDTWINHQLKLKTEMRKELY